jgi:hypothetical protein
MEHELDDRAEAVEGIRKGLKSVQEGRTRGIEEVFEDIRREHEAPRSDHVGHHTGNRENLSLD